MAHTKLTYPYKLPELGFDYAALEPSIDARTMDIHFNKHHGGYVNKLNAALEGRAELQRHDLVTLLGNLDAVPESIRQAVRNNGGGHLNHFLFWQILKPGGASAPQGELRRAIEGKLGSFDAFKEEFSQAAMNRFGSGWAWLVITAAGELKVISTPNQDAPSMTGDVPLLGLDVWEHAYYLHYQNRRDEYVANFWNVVNWDVVGHFFEQHR
ncbi:MAG: superoxide dismutase [Acidobacteria bacterium]|nr:superoxide dismutase [Acidobacteriota bacterium]